MTVLRIPPALLEALRVRERRRPRMPNQIGPHLEQRILAFALAPAWDSQPMSQTLSIPGRFNGPPTSGHGGYCSGVIAGFLEGPAEVTLRSPVPLDTPLEVIRERDGSVRVLEGETLVAEAHPAPELELEAPGPVSVEEARLAKTRYRGPTDGLF